MKIQRCIICNKPFFPDPKTSTDYAMDFDPAACHQCNGNARQNSIPPINNQTF